MPDPAAETREPSTTELLLCIADLRASLEWAIPLLDSTAEREAADDPAHAAVLSATAGSMRDTLTRTVL